MKLFAVSSLFPLLACFATLSQAQTTTWTGNSGDNLFETAGNWSNGVPTASTNALVTGSSLITIDQTTALQHALTLTIGGAGTVDLNIAPAGTLSITGETPSNTAEDILVEQGGTLNVAGGTLQLQDGIMDVGTVNGSGTFNLTGGSLNYDVQTTSDDTQVNVGHGGVGVFTQSGTSTVVTGEVLFIGSNGGAGSYTLSGSSNLSTGSVLSSGRYFIAIGTNDEPDFTGTSGTLTISGNSSVTVNAGGDLQVGSIAIPFGSGSVPDGTKGGTGVFVQNSAGSIVNLLAGSSVQLGAFSGGVGSYDLSAGMLNIDGDQFLLGDDTDTVGTLNQSGGTLSVGGATLFDIGTLGQGNYNLSSGTATVAGEMVLGDTGGAVGTWTQTNGTFVATATSEIIIGASATGIYNLSGGTSEFQAGLTVGPTGTINQTGGTFKVDLGQSMDLSSAGGVYNLKGGILQVGNNGTNGILGTSDGGRLNFEGGRLQVLAGGGPALVDALNGTVTNTSILDVTNGGLSLTGTLSGAGGFVVTGPGTATLLASDTYTGPTTIDAGSILALNVADSTDKFGSGIEGAGNLRIDFAATGNVVELAGNSNLSGITTLGFNGTSGTLKVFDGTFGAIGDAGSASNLTIGGDASIATSGAVFLTGANSFRGVTTINSGFRLVANNLTGDVDNLGTMEVYPDSPYITGTFSMAGNLTSPGVLLVRTNGVAADLYRVTQTADLTSGTIAISGFGTLATPVPIVTAATLTAPLNSITLDIAGAHVLFTGTLSEVGNSLELTTQQLPTADFAQTANERSVSGAIDPVLLHPNLYFVTPSTEYSALATTFNNLTASQIPGALDQLSPESLQYARNISVENATYLAQGMNGVMAKVRGGYTGMDTSGLSIVNPGLESGMGRSLQSLLAYNSPAYFQQGTSGSTSKARTVSDSADEANSPAASAEQSEEISGRRVSEFIRGDVILADLNRDQSVQNAPPTKASYTAGDASAGVSYRMTSNLAAGVLFDYNHTDAKTDDSGSKTKVDTYSPGVYATYFNGGFYVNGLAAYGYNSYSNTRNISFAGLSAKSSPDGNQYIGNLDFGYDFQPAKHWLLGPTLGATYTHLDIGSFAENGAGIGDLAVNSESLDSVRSRLGGHVLYQTHFDHVTLQPNLTAMWQHEYLDDSSGITSQLGVPGTTPFTIQTAAPARDSALVGVGISATLDNEMAHYLNYLADVGTGDYFTQSVEGGFKAKF